MKDKVKVIMASVWNVYIDDLPDSCSLNNYDKWDSLSHIKLMLELEKELGLELSPDSIQNLNSLEKIVNALTIE